MKLENSLKLDDHQINRLENLYTRYKMMYEDPDNCSPMFIIDVPVANIPRWEEQIEDPLVMLKAGLDELRTHLEIEDDRVPTVRVEFGTCQVAAAFGCEIAVPTNSLPAVKSHVMQNAEDIYSMKKPSLDAGMYRKLKEYTDIFLENLPEGVHMQHPDIQGPFNTAHLIRGNDILMDFYDAPEAVDALLGMVTDYMIDLVPYLKNMISTDHEWFFDWGALWKGAARISNCSMHMISTDFYKEHIFKHDVKFFETVGGSRIHYCGSNKDVIDEFFRIPNLKGLDFVGNLDAGELWNIAGKTPKHVTLLKDVGINSKEMNRLISGDWPKKRNIIIISQAGSIDEAREVLAKLRQSVC